MDGSNDEHASSPRSDSLSTPDPPHEPLANHDNNHSGDKMHHPVRAEQLKNLVMEFLATSNGESLIGAFVVLIIATYVLLGRLGLLLIGLVLGVVLHASWEGTSNDPPSGAISSRYQRRRKELALELTNRLLDRPQGKSTETGNEAGDHRQMTTEGRLETDINYSVFGSRTSVALKSLTDAVIRDYVL